MSVIADRYELGAVVGTGSSAVVHRAWDRRREAVVAVKIVRVDVVDPRRHRLEMDALTRVRHPGLVALHDGGVDGGVPYLVLDLVDGPTLAERILLDGPLDPAAARRLGARVADALAAVHAAGLVHRDVKPANVLLEPDGTPRLTDFGIAVALDATSVTQAGAVLGTAAFLAPEQVRGRAVAGAADVYALGLVLLEAVTGRREYPGPAVESATARLHRAPVVPRDLPAPLARAIRAMTSSDPARRPTAAAVAALLAADPATSTIPVWQRVATAHRPWLAGAAAVAVGAAALGVVLLGAVPGAVRTAPVVAMVVPAPAPVPSQAAVPPVVGSAAVVAESRAVEPVAVASPERGASADAPRSRAEERAERREQRREDRAGRSGDRGGPREGRGAGSGRGSGGGRN